MTSINNFKKYYLEKVVPELQKTLKIKNKMGVPKITKIKVNIGIGSYMQRTGSKDPGEIAAHLATITGQKPIITTAKKAISNFKLRQGMPVGAVVTLRGSRMYDFLNKMINIVMPRIRDFRGLSKKSFDGQGNYSIGIKEHVVFPEINPDDISKIHGVQVTINTSAQNDEQAYQLLLLLGFPFKEAKNTK